MFITTALIIFLILPTCGYGIGPALDFKPSALFKPDQFDRVLKPLWGEQNQAPDPNHYGVQLTLDRTTGSGFRSELYAGGYFETSIQLPEKDYTAGLNVAFYLSNQEDRKGHHDEVDMEFLGTAGKNYKLQTNVYLKGSGDGFFDHKTPVVGREMTFDLWFDPAQQYHRYAILWTPTQIIFFVDDIPIRHYPKKSSATYPENAMREYISIWDASDWATEGGRVKMNYSYAPFLAKYKNFKVDPNPSGRASTLSDKQKEAMAWAQQNHVVYNYCTDGPKPPPPECS